MGSKFSLSRSSSPKSEKPASNSPVKKTSPKRPQHEFLTDDEQAIVKRTWAKLSANDAQEMGIQIFLRIFELAPDTKNAFTSFRELDTATLTTNIMFRSHATRFMRAVESTMNNLEALDVIIVPNLMHLGRRHTDFHGFHPEYLKAFEVAMEEVWREKLADEFTPSAELAWRKIFHLITSKVAEGYEESNSKLDLVCSTGDARSCPNGKLCNGGLDITSPDIVGSTCTAIGINGTRT